MTALSRRALVTATAASLLTACAGTGTRTDTGPGTGAGTGTDTAGGAAAGSPTGAGTAGSTARPAKSPSPLPRSVPTNLRVPAIGVNTPLLKLGLAADGTVQVPPVTAHDRAGWYAYSPTPGQTGPAVLLGHVTVGAYGDGVFRHLDRLRAGDRIAVRLRSGREPEFAVTSVRTVAKAEFPVEDVYGDVARPELRLITCGGPRTGDGYRDNVIVFARLV
ncbi:class F sortase [Streptomyces sp. NPDC008150]|uniref:class F sortase n=1 Tax=Streptomyces sp. NPDC008150 TaxID=3364816 RepID=UPI0036F05F4A